MIDEGYDINSWVDKVRSFHESRLRNDLPSNPVLIKNARIEQNFEHLSEELKEIIEGYNENDLAEVADGIIDLIYVAIGFGCRLGLPMEALFSEVHLANMEKVHDPNAADHEKRVIKPLGWQPPRIAKILEESRK